MLVLKRTIERIFKEYFKQNFFKSLLDTLLDTEGHINKFWPIIHSKNVRETISNIHISFLLKKVKKTCKLNHFTQISEILQRNNVPMLDENLFTPRQEKKIFGLWQTLECKTITYHYNVNPDDNNENFFSRENMENIIDFGSS